LLFGLQVAASVICIVAATVLTALGDRRQLAEIGLLGSGLMAASVMPLVHGLVTPGVLYDDTSAFRASAALTLPIAVAAGAPLISPHSSFGRWAARHWRDWTLVAVLGVFVIAAVMTFFPDAIPAPDARGPVTVIVTLALMGALVAFAARQFKLFEIGRRTANLVASLALVLIAVTALLPIVKSSYTLSFWWLHIAGMVGVLVACVALAASHTVHADAVDVLRPVVDRDPLVAFELGLSPSVHRFVSSLDQKDHITRDHVVRTAEIAMRVGERFRLPARQLRELGLAALLHDIGKADVPDEILGKPSRLTAEEYELIKRHAVDGERMLRAERTLAKVAPIVRSHHERMDGRGYPDGLAGRDIPLASRIIAACDAYDAMTRSKPYRAGMSPRTAFAVLREHSGSQWDPAVIEQLIMVLPTMSVTAALDHVGRFETTDTPVDAELHPAELAELLAAVDVEI
jgi:putative nucleotidyltransferase with HDIG domain